MIIMYIFASGVSHRRVVKYIIFIHQIFIAFITCIVFPLLYTTSSEWNIHVYIISVHSTEPVNKSTEHGGCDSARASECLRWRRTKLIIVRRDQRIFLTFSVQLCMYCLNDTATDAWESVRALVVAQPTQVICYCGMKAGPNAYNNTHGLVPFARWRPMSSRLRGIRNNQRTRSSGWLIMTSWSCS